MSSLISPEHVKECTLENALQWGICRSHFYQAQIQTQWGDRIVHLVLGIIEAIPVIGQIVSLIERKIIEFYCPPARTLSMETVSTSASPDSSTQPSSSLSTSAAPASSSQPTPSIPSQRVVPFPLPVSLSQPRSCIPQIRLTKLQETDTDICRFWPEDLTLLGLNDDQKNELDKHIRDAFRAGTFAWEKGRLKYDDGVTSVDAPLPLTLSVIKDDSNYRVLLFPKTVFASGGERKIRWAYDLTHGTFLLKKRIVGVFEERLLKVMFQARMSRGIQTSPMWRSSVDKQALPKRQIIEPVRDGALPTLYRTEPFTRFSVKRDLILDLLADLKSLHEISLQNVEITPSIGFRTPIKVGPYHAFHNDLKPLNILTFCQNGKWRGEICDFGQGAAHPTAFVISLGFTPPEYIRFYKQQRPLGIQSTFSENLFASAQFNIAHGQGRDIWSLGLVILSILVERTEEITWNNHFDLTSYRADFPPLPSLKACIPREVWSHYDEEGVLGLKQESINQDLDKLTKEVVARHPQDKLEVEKMFRMLKMMLAINLNERKSITEVLDSLMQDPQLIA